MWLSSPLASPLFWPAVRVAGGILAVALMTLAIWERRHLREVHRRELFKRLFTWTLIAPVFVMAVLGGRVPLLLFVGALVSFGLWEYARLVGLPEAHRWVLVSAGLVAAPAALFSPFAFYALPGLLLITATLLPLLLQDTKRGVRDLALALLGWGYIAWLLGHFLMVFLYTAQGPALLLAVGLAVALSDVGAYVVGKAFGRHKLAPALSPNKTWEGVAGNLLGAAVGVGLIQLALPGGLPFPLAAALPAVVGIGAVWGDLLESALKREFGAKDAGAWLPGFGGLLDRIDSLIVVLPLVYYAALVAERL